MTGSCSQHPGLVARHADTAFHAQLPDITRAGIRPRSGAEPPTRSDQQCLERVVTNVVAVFKTEDLPATGSWGPAASSCRAPRPEGRAAE